MPETLLEIAYWFSNHAKGDIELIHFKEQLEDIAYFLEIELQNTWGSVDEGE